MSSSFVLRPGHHRYFIYSTSLPLLFLSLFLLFASSAMARTNVSGTISQNTEWTTGGSPYVVQSSVSVATGVTLTIDSGVVVKFQSTSTSLTVNGTLNATGSVFTSYKDDAHGGDTNGDGSASSPAPGNWKNINFATSSSGTISGCSILFGGNSYANTSELYIAAGSATITGNTISSSQTAGISVGSGTVSITNNTVSGNQGNYGIFSSARPAALYGNNISDNRNAMAVFIPANLGQGTVYNNTYSGNKYNAMFLNGAGNVSANSTWPVSNSPYVIGANGNINVQNNAALTIDPGVIVKFWASGSINWDRLQVYTGSTLNATDVIFTSYYDDAHGGDTNGDGSATSPAPGNWGSIYFNGGAGTLSGSTVSYGGGSQSAQIMADNNASVTISGSTISNSKTTGIYTSSGGLSIHYNDVFANKTYGISSSVSLDATNNYWGSKHGPKPFGTGNGFSGSVTASPWSKVPFTQAGADYQSTLGMDDYCGLCGDPINTATGAFVYEHEDVKIPTRGLPLEFKRTYNSNDQNDGPLGYGWSNTWQISANQLSNGNVIILRGDGRQDIFTRNADGSYSPPPRRHDTLVRNQNGTYTLATQDQIIYNFGTDNQLVSEVSETGQTTTLTYDANKRLTTITEPAGRTLTFTYNAANRIDEITDPQSNTVSFIYSTAGDLTQVTDQNGGVTHFTYDDNHHITGVTDPNNHTSANNTYDALGRVVSQTNAEGHLLTFAYDSVNRKTTMTTQMDPNDPSQDQVRDFYYDSQLRLARQTDPFGNDTLFTYDSQGNRDSSTDRRGVETRQTYDAYGNIVDLYKAFGLTEQQHAHYTYNSKNHPVTKTDARGYTTTYGYDASGTYLEQIGFPQVTSYDNSTATYSEYFTYNTDGTLATSTDRNGDETRYAYDTYGNPVSEARNTNRPTADQVDIGYMYDSLGRKTEVTDGNGQTTTYQYDNLGHPRYVTKQVTDPGTNQLVDVTTEYRYDDAGNKTAEIDPEGKTTAFAYTAADRLSQVTDAKLHTIQYSYDAAGNKTAAKDRNGNWTNFTFDKNNLMVSSTDPESNTTNYGYDEEGNQISVTDPLGRARGMTYDGLGRLTSASEPDDGNITRTISYTYDSANNLLTATDPASHTYTNVYDELGRLKQATDALSNSVYNAYDGMGNRTKMKDGLGHETTYGFSPNDSLTSVTDAAGGVTSYEYDKNGNMTGQTNAESHTTIYVYDELNRLKEEKVDAGGGNFLLDRSYAYNKAGQVTADTTGDGTIAYTYDDVYNITGLNDRQSGTYSFTYDARQNQLAGTDIGANKTVSFSYNTRNLISSSTDAHGAQEDFTYDDAGNLIQRDDTVAGQNFTTTFDHTPRNQVKTVTRGTDTSTFTFDALGNLAAKSYPNGVNTSYGYDNNGRLTALEAQKGGQTLQSYAQTFDAAGNITQLTENASLDTYYSYDELNRLTSEDIEGFGQISYAYDHSGNRTDLDNPVTGHTDYTYNEANQLIQTVNGSDTTDFSYNAGGALTQKTNGQDTTSYAYNGRDKLTEVTTPSTTVDYSHDALGRRISRTEGAETRNIHLSAKSDLEDYETNSAGNLTSATLRGPDGLISQTDYSGTPATSYELYSPHGDLTGATDETGTINYGARLDAFGNTVSGGGSSLGHTGKWQRVGDPATGTIRMGAREYDPALGRFISVDPLKGDANDPQLRNRYQYARNNPLTKYDLDGREVTEEISPGQITYTSTDLDGNSEEIGIEPAASVSPSEADMNTAVTLNDEQQARQNAENSGMCEGSELTDIDQYLNPSGYRHVGAYKIELTGQDADGVNIYSINIPGHPKAYVSARNPYLNEYAKDMFFLMEASQHTAAEGLDSLLRNLSGDLNVPSTNGPDEYDYYATELKRIYGPMIEWEQNCGSQ